MNPAGLAQLLLPILHVLLSQKETASPNMSWDRINHVEQEMRERNFIRRGLDAMDLNKENALKFLVDGTNYGFLPDEFRGNPTFLLKAIETHPDAIEHAPDELRNRQDIIKLAYKHDPRTIRFAPQEIICNTAFVLSLIEECDPKMLYTVAQQVKKWEQFTDEITAALITRSSPHVVDDDLYDLTYNKMFSSFPDEIINKKWVAMAALQAGNQLYWRLGHVLKSDEDVIRCVIEHSIKEFRAVPQECITESIALAAVSKDGKTFMQLSAALKDDADVLLAALPTYFHAMNYASRRLLSDKETVLRCVNIDGNALIYVSRWLQSDPEVGLAAVGKIGSAISLLCPRPNWCTSNLIQALAITTLETALECTSCTHCTAPALILLLKQYFHQKKQYLEGTRMLMFGAFIPPPPELEAGSEFGSKRVYCCSEETSILQKLNQHGPHFARLFKKNIASYLRPRPNRIMQEEAHLIPMFDKWCTERGITLKDLIDLATAKIIRFYA
jgi:hypothetical protein